MSESEWHGCIPKEQTESPSSGRYPETRVYSSPLRVTVRPNHQSHSSCTPYQEKYSKNDLPLPREASKLQHPYLGANSARALPRVDRKAAEQRHVLCILQSTHNDVGADLQSAFILARHRIPLLGGVLSGLDVDVLLHLPTVQPSPDGGERSAEVTYIL